MLVSSALVLMMTGPGLALFYCGLVRKKNVLGTMMQSFAMMAVITLLWAVCGYSLVFGTGNAFIGDLRYLFLRDVGAAPNPLYAPTIPHQTFMIYQLMFAIITPALIAGAFAERVRFRAMMMFSILWAFFVYFPVAHMVWGNGGFLNAFLGGKCPVFDFAGGTVVHITSGFSALITALYIGKRTGYPHDKIVPHNLVLSFIGACLLWVGWFGFNAGSALAASALATSAFVATHFAAAAGAVAWMAAERIRNGKASALGAISGAGRRARHRHPGRGLRAALQRRAHRPDRGRGVLPDGLRGEGESCATTIRSTLSAFTASAAWWDACSRECSPRGWSTPGSSWPTASPPRWAGSTATRLRCSTSSSAPRSASLSPLSARSSRSRSPIW